MKILGYNITISLPILPIEGKTIINTINPHSYCVALKDEKFSNVLHESDILLPDGVGIVWAAKLLKGESIQKIAGFDVFIYLMKHLNGTNGSCFFLGSSDDTLKKIIEKASQEFPNTKVNVYSPPYKTQFTKEDCKLMCEKVNEVKPKILFVGMTAPKQEKWVYENKDKLDVDIICSIGAVFDFYAGSVKRPSKFWINLGLEWFPRFLKDPKRLAKRNLISTPKFIIQVFIYKITGVAFFK